MDDQEEFKEFTRKIEDFVEDLLDSYKPYKPLVPKRTKVIHDPVWGTQVYTPAEIAFIDSPLIQRLRFIHQTGLAFYTYPSANHTRFEHSLGTMTVVTKMAEKLNEKAKDTVKKPDLKRLRLAALFHDCGHGVFSHISEDIYRDHPFIKKLTEQKKFSQTKPKPHELLSYFIVKSEKFRKYFYDILSKYEEDLEITNDQIADLILGRAVKGLSYLGKMINGPFDADKIDYIVRDSYFIGLPMTVDIERLFYAINPEPIDDENGEVHLVAHSSGISAIEEIVSNKIRLFDRLYHHPKVRAADRMMYNFMRYARDNIGELQDISEIICREPLDFLLCSERTFMDISKKEEEKIKGSHVLKFINRLKFRDLPMKALVINTKTVESGQMIRLQNERDRSDWEDIQFNIQSRIFYDVPKNLFKGLTAYDIIVDIPDPPQINEARLTYVKLGKKSKPQLLSDLFPLAQYWLDAYSINKWYGHVFCPSEPKELRKKIWEICEEVFPNTPAFKLQLNEDARTLTNMDDYLSLS